MLCLLGLVGKEILEPDGGCFRSPQLGKSQIAVASPLPRHKESHSSFSQSHSPNDRQGRIVSEGFRPAGWSMPRYSVPRS